MEIIFDEKPGEVYDFFNSLWIMNNYEYCEEIRMGFGIKKNNKFDETIKDILNNKNFDKKNVKRYFYRELELNIVLLCEMWKYPTIEECLYCFKNIDEFELRKKIIMLVMKAVREKKEEYEIEKLACDDKSVINYIEKKDIDIGLKWEISLFLNNKQKYINDFSEFIKKYRDTYKILDIERKKIITQFNSDLEKNIKERGLEYINETINYIVDIEKYEKIYITTSASINFYISHDIKEKSCYIIMGKYSNETKNDKEENLTFIRNIVDNTRFYIIKQLMEKDCYGQQIADSIGITKSTVSHHMNFLISSRAVSIKKRGKKVYYSLNKAALRRNIEFLLNEFNL